MTMLLVGLGGACGAVSRYACGRLFAKRTSVFPLGIFLINLSGAVLLGLINGHNLSSSLYLIFADGFCGAFTTFSTFMYDGFTLLKENYYLNALIYIVGSVILGIIGYGIGVNL